MSRLRHHASQPQPSESRAQDADAQLENAAETAPASTGAREQTADEGHSWAEAEKILKTLGSIVAPTTLITALLYYFGWVRTDEQASFLGLDESVLGFTVEDYLLRSISSMYQPLGVGLLTILAWLWLNSWINDFARGQPPATQRPNRRKGATDPRRSLSPSRRLDLLRLITQVMGGVGSIGVAFAVFEIAADRHDVGRPALPLIFAFGIAMLGNARYLHRRHIQQDNGSGLPAKAKLPILESTLIVLLIFLALFWAVSNYALSVGRAQAAQLVTFLHCRPTARIYSENALLLEAPGVVTNEFEEPGSAYRFRYEGLKLLLRSDDKYFLLPEDWTQQRVVFVLADNDAIRVDFIQEADLDACP